MPPINLLSRAAVAAHLLHDHARSWGFRPYGVHHDEDGARDGRFKEFRTVHALQRYLSALPAEVRATGLTIAKRVAGNAVRVANKRGSRWTLPPEFRRRLGHTRVRSAA